MKRQNFNAGDALIEAAINHIQFNRFSQSQDNGAF